MLTQSIHQKLQIVDAVTFYGSSDSRIVALFETSDEFKISIKFKSLFKIMADNWKTTAEMYTALIQKPKMTEKLLCKPPFKYLFDIIMETSKKTGFAKGLYEGNEASGDYYKDRDTKLGFLTKIIQLTELMSGNAIEAKPQKIVAGLEPEHTNTLLQEIHKLATSKTPSDPYVKKVLGGADAEQEEERPEKKEPEKKKIQRPPSAARGKKPLEQPKRVEPEPEEEPQEVKKPTKEKSKKEEYSKKVQELMDEGEEEAMQQKAQQKKDEEVSAPTSKNQLGNLRKKKKGDKTSAADKIISSATGELNEKELEMLQSMIQTICQNTAPLGKSIEFINDDIESMNKELQFWRRQYNASKGKMQNELKITEESLLPVYDKIAEIEEQIKDQKGKIQNSKAQIIKNDSTIRDLLMSVVTTK